MYVSDKVFMFSAKILKKSNDSCSDYDINKLFMWLC